MFQKILIANRGEIACRVIRTAKRLGIKTVAVYSEADAHALHVKQADESYLIGPAPSFDSYLRADKIIEVALKSHAQAIHPGYGFLSENANFAEKCQQNGICFIGPPANAIRSMGEKNTAKQLMSEAKIPTIPGYLGEDQDPKALQKAAAAIGFPVLIKAVAGGGGKGMRVVNAADEFEHALAAAKREAKASFNDDRVLLEKYLQQPRHIEAQVFADSHGQALYLFERDCSIQRRHQKIIEEAPAPQLSDALRQRIGQTAVKAAQAIAYEGAGTIEFLLDQHDEFYFMEMNTRLQVEHPVTEMITGFDLVEWQIRIAAGENLPVTQNEIHYKGHAIEARICAEDPGKNFMPSVGQIWHLTTPHESTEVRIDSGVTQGDNISVYYDPLISKLIAWGKDRASALRHLRKALTEFHVLGVSTNIALLMAVLDNPDFIQEKISTDFIERHQKTLLPPPTAASNDIMFTAGLALVLLQKQQALRYAETSTDPQSPWFSRNQWLLNQTPIQTLNFWEHDHLVTIQIAHEASAYQLNMGETKATAQGTIDASGHLKAIINDQLLEADIVQNDQAFYIFSKAQLYTFNLGYQQNHSGEQAESNSRLIAPMPGTIVNINVNSGKKVNKGDSLLVIEAMKMEHTLYAPADGVVKEVFYKVGDLINEGVELLRFEVYD
jgi:3-methylcrotonyl-CoA carboxylase alpha subunit